MRALKPVGDILLTRAFAGQGGARRHRFVDLGGEDYALGLAGLEVQLEGGRPQQVLQIVQTASALLAVPEAPIPLRLYCNIRAGAQNAIGSCAIVRMNLHTAGNRLDAECSLAAE